MCYPRHLTPPPIARQKLTTEESIAVKGKGF